MALVEKFRTLTQEQQEKLSAMKEAAQLDVFLSQLGMELSPEEKAQAEEFLRTGKLPLSDEELENVAGGGCPSPDDYPKRQSTTDEFEEFRRSLRKRS